MENGLEELQRLQDIFNTALMNNYSVPFWQLYINFIQRRFNLTVAPQDRPTVQKAWEFALDRVGIDKDAGDVWQDYISFLKSAPGNVGGSGWQDAQKMDLLRKGYQRAICVPTQAVTSLWKDYDKFEMDLNKTTVRVESRRCSLHMLTLATGPQILAGKVTSVYDSQKLIHCAAEHHQGPQANDTAYSSASPRVRR